VGKSSLLNAFVGKSGNRQPHLRTTRDAIDTVIERQEQIYRLIDTAGIRKKNVEYGPESLELTVLLRQSDALI